MDGIDEHSVERIMECPLDGFEGMIVSYNNHRLSQGFLGVKNFGFFKQAMVKVIEILVISNFSTTNLLYLQIGPAPSVQKHNEGLSDAS